MVAGYTKEQLAEFQKLEKIDQTSAERRLFGKTKGDVAKMLVAIKSVQEKLLLDNPWITDNSDSFNSKRSTRSS